MSKPQKHLNNSAFHDVIRTEWLRRLRTEGHRQCQFHFFDHTGTRVCAMGLLIEVLDDFGVVDKLDAISFDLFELGAYAGLGGACSVRVAEKNDGEETYGDPMPFDEIADFVECVTQLKRATR